MKAMTVVGLLLVVLGAAGLLYGGITWTKNRETTDLGLFEVTVEDKEHLSIHPAIGGLLIVAGGAVLWSGRRKG
ncbi:MAG TPA: hypothetical protein VKU85_06795 [bacterium]|nr:hypothetical protein [bacterium]